MSASLLGSGPAPVLVALARRLRLPFDPDDVNDRVAGHAAPLSLLALVEVAQTLGLTARAFQAEWDELAEIPLPAVVHLQGEDDGGFALLLEHGPGGVVLEVPPRRERVRADRERFASLWSGVVVLLERDAAARPVLESSPGLLRTGAPLSAPRLAAIVACVVLALAGAVRFGVDRGSVLAGLAAAVVCALTFSAAAVSAVLVLASRRSRVPSATPRLVSKICGRGSLLDCEGVLGSRFSRVGGVELSVLGLALLGGAAVLETLAAALPADARAGLASWLAWALLAMAPGALLLIGVQVWPLRRFCPLCMTVHACVLMAAGLASPLLTQSSVLEFAPWAILHGAAALGTAGVLVPFLEGSIEIRTQRSRLAWIGATPWGALAEVAGRPAEPDWQLPDHARLGSGSAPFRADVLVHPTCGGCPPLLESLEELLARRPQDVQVVLQFPTRDPARPEDRELCVALAAIGCLRGGRAALDAFLRAKASVWKLLEASRAGGAPAVLRVLAPDLAPDDASLRSAGEAVDRADRVLTDLRRGTPTLLIGGRPWDSPLEDFEALLGTQPHQLASVLRPAGGVPEEERA